MNKKELWIRLNNYHFNHVVPSNLWDHITEVFGGTDASTKAFASKIARKHNWKLKYALKAVTEYKKFVYLGVVSEFSVTPSKIIDIVWHEHLLFTKAYRDFCSDVIHYTFDHSPELIPMTDQTGNYNAQYIDTIELYKKEFGINPPEAIWSQPKYELEKVMVNKKYYSQPKKNRDTDSNGGDTYYADSNSLSSYFGTDAEDLNEFNGFDNGDFGGAGSGSDWSDPSDSGGDSSGDSGSSCSSSCGGGCGGGD
jgi:hypothetical protein